MNGTAQYAIERAPAQVAALTVSGVRALASRGRMDLLCLEEAAEWLRKGMEMHNAAFSDPGWLAVVDTQSNAKNDPGRHAQFRLILEYLRMVTEGADPETTCAYLNMSEEDRETAYTLRNFWPDTSASLVRAMQKEREEEHANLLRHEERLKRAFLCFQTGYSLDPYNREINFILAEYYSVGLGITRDDEAALSHLRRSAALGHIAAQRALSYRYSANLRSGMGQDASTTWLPRAAERPAEVNWAGQHAHTSAF